MNFLKEFEKTVSKVEGITSESEPPRYWHSLGNHVLNYTMSGDFNNGIPQGRVTGLAGPSGSGKSFILGNALREAQKDGAFVLCIDSENALDSDFLEKIGVDTQNNYIYKSVVTHSHVTKVVSTFLSSYRKEYGDDLENGPKVLIGIDSLDMLMTETETEHYSKGNQKGDQGQRNKITKAMLRSFVQDVKDLNVAIVCTSQVYKNQDIMNGEGVWIVSDAVRYSMSHIALLTKLKLKGDEAGTFDGIRMRCQGFKTRFTKPFQKVEIEVPYETGMNPYTGLLEAAMDVDVVKKKGNKYYVSGDEDNTWFKKDFNDIIGQQILCALQGDETLTFNVDSGNDDKQDNSVKNRRFSKGTQLLNEEEK